MIKESLDKLIEAFPEWRDQLVKPSLGKEWERSVESPSGQASLVFSISDRLSIKFGKERLEFFHAEEAIDTLRDIKNDNLVSMEYYLDRELATRLGQEPPDGLPSYQGGSLVKGDEVPLNNSDWYFANKIRVTSWSGKLDSDKEAVYGQ